MQLQAKQRLTASAYSQDDISLIEQVISLAAHVCSVKERGASIGQSHFNAEFVGTPSPASIQKLVTELKQGLLRGFPFRSGTPHEDEHTVKYFAFDASSSRPMSVLLNVMDDGRIMLSGYSRRNKK